MNDAGQFAFFLNLQETPFPDDFGIYFHDDALGLLKVARAGDPLLGSTIDGVRTSTFFGTSLNGAGQVVNSFHLQDGREGIAVVGAGAVGSDDDCDRGPVAATTAAATRL